MNRPKAPLRLVTKRTWHSMHSMTETLECGHTFWQHHFPEIACEPPTAKRRRCKECEKLQKFQNQQAKIARPLADATDDQIIQLARNWKAGPN